MKSEAKKYYPNHSISSLLREGRRSYLWGKYEKPFEFNIAVNDLHVNTSPVLLNEEERDDKRSVTE